MVLAFRPACFAISKKVTPSEPALSPPAGFCDVLRKFSATLANAGRSAPRRFSSDTTKAYRLNDFRNFRREKDNRPVTLPFDPTKSVLHSARFFGFQHSFAAQK